MTSNLDKKFEAVLVVEDDAKMLELLIEEIEDLGYQAYRAQNLKEAKSILNRFQVEVIVSDLNLPEGSGLEILDIIDRYEIKPRFVVITAFGSVPQAVEALKRGADDFIVKPLDLDHFSIALKKHIEIQSLKKETSLYRKSLGKTDFHGVIGRSHVMRDLFIQVHQLAKSDAAVLVMGESGVGKELIARAVHQESPRKSGPFVAINCAGIPDELLESELFGYVSGAFTGANRDKKGLFVEANGGTFFLDEVGEMSSQMQAKLLRVIQEQSFRPLGSTKEMNIDVRIVTATNRDLEREMNEGRFREDLYYRLETFSVYIPPLRDRMEDLDLLVNYILNKLAIKLNKQVGEVSKDVLAVLKSYSFPGNIRELENILERALTFSQVGNISIDNLPSKLQKKMEGSSSKSFGNDQQESGGVSLFSAEEPLPSLSEIDRRYLKYVLQKVEGNKKRAAAILGIGRKTLYRYLAAEDEKPS
ncbi:MAG: sigma-54-dependent transcriptional regulator [Oligoflexus sp.]